MVEAFPPAMRVEEIETGGATIHTRIGGTGPAVVMLHGFADTGDMWAPLATCTRLSSSSRPFPGRHRQQGPRRQRQARHAGAGHRRRQVFGTAQSDALRVVASDVTGQVIADSGHWLMEEQPAATVAAIVKFLNLD